MAQKADAIKSGKILKPGMIITINGKSTPHRVLDAGRGFIAIVSGSEAYTGTIPPENKLKAIDTQASVPLPGNGTVVLMSASGKYCTGEDYYMKCKEASAATAKKFKIKCIQDCEWKPNAEIAREFDSWYNAMKKTARATAGTDTDWKPFGTEDTCF